VGPIALGDAVRILAKAKPPTQTQDMVPRAELARLIDTTAGMKRALEDQAAKITELEQHIKKRQKLDEGHHQTMGSSTATQTTTATTEPAGFEEEEPLEQLEQRVLQLWNQKLSEAIDQEEESDVTSVSEDEKTPIKDKIQKLLQRIKDKHHDLYKDGVFQLQNKCSQDLTWIAAIVVPLVILIGISFAVVVYKINCLRKVSIKTYFTMYYSKSRSRLATCSMTCFRMR